MGDSGAQPTPMGKLDENGQKRLPYVHRNLQESAPLVQSVDVSSGTKISISELREPCQQLLYDIPNCADDDVNADYVPYYLSLVLSIVIRARLQSNTEYDEQNTLLVEVYNASFQLFEASRTQEGLHIQDAVCSLRTHLPYHATIENVLNIMKMTESTPYTRPPPKAPLLPGVLFNACRFAIRAEYSENVGFNETVPSKYFSPLEDVRSGYFMRAVSGLHSPMLFKHNFQEAFLDPHAGICPVLEELVNLRRSNPSDQRSYAFIAMMYSVIRLVNAFKVEEHDVDRISLQYPVFNYVLSHLLTLIEEENGHDPMDWTIIPCDEHPEVKQLFTSLSYLTVWLAHVDTDELDAMNITIELFQHIESRHVLNRTLLLSFQMLFRSFSSIDHVSNSKNEMMLEFLRERDRLGAPELCPEHIATFGKAMEYLDDMRDLLHPKLIQDVGFLYSFDWMENSIERSLETMGEIWSNTDTDTLVRWICGLFYIPSTFPHRSQAVSSARLFVEYFMKDMVFIAGSKYCFPAVFDIIAIFNEKRFLSMERKDIVVTFAHKNGTIEADLSYNSGHLMQTMRLCTLSWLLPNAFQSVSLLQRCTIAVERIPKHRIEDRLDCYRRLLWAYCEYKDLPTDAIFKRYMRTPQLQKSFIQTHDDDGKRFAELMFNLRRKLVHDLREVANTRLPFVAQPPSKLLNASIPEWEVVSAVTDGHDSYRNMYKKLCSVIHGRLIKFCSDASVVETSIRVECPLPGDEVVTQFGDMVTKIVQHYLGAVYCVSSDSSSASIATNLRSDYAVWTDVPEPGSNGKSKVVVGVRKPLFDPHVAAYVEARALKTRAAVALREFLE